MSTGRGAKAIRAFQKATRIENQRPTAFNDEVVNRHSAERARAEARDLLTLGGRLVQGAGEVAVWDPDPTEKVRFRDPEDQAQERLFDTLEHSNSISVRASEHRMEEAAAAGILKAAADAAVSAQAANSLENMLCHQMAAAHHMAIKQMTRAADPKLPPVEQARLTKGECATDAGLPGGPVGAQEVPHGWEAADRRLARPGFRRRSRRYGVSDPLRRSD